MAVWADASKAGVRLDVALVSGLGAEGPFDHDVGFAEALLDVPMAELAGRGDIRGFAIPAEALMKDRRTLLHCLFDIRDVRQHLVVDIDQLQRLLRYRRRGRRHCGDGVAVVERLIARHAVDQDVAQVVVAILEIGGGHHGFHAR